MGYQALLKTRDEILSVLRTWNVQARSLWGENARHDIYIFFFFVFPALTCASCLFFFAARKALVTSSEYFLLKILVAFSALACACVLFFTAARSL